LILTPPAMGQGGDFHTVQPSAPQADRRIAAEANDGNAQPARRRTPSPSPLHQTIAEVTLSQLPAREAFAWWQEQTGISLLMDWQVLAQTGVDPQTRIELKLDNISALQVLKLMMRQLGTQSRLVYEVTPWYVQVQTRAQANRQSVLKMYDVRSLLMEVPNFTDAPRFDLRSALESRVGRGGSGGGSGSGEGGLFGDEAEQAQREPARTERQRGERLIQIITRTIEPDIWQRNGGRSGRIDYHRGLLLVHAPRYVHRQIGVPFSQGPDHEPGNQTSTFVTPKGAAQPNAGAIDD
jgi:hypothetical protein